MSISSRTISRSSSSRQTEDGRWKVKDKCDDVPSLAPNDNRNESPVFNSSRHFKISTLSSSSSSASSSAAVHLRNVCEDTLSSNDGSQSPRTDKRASKIQSSFVSLIPSSQSNLFSSRTSSSSSSSTTPSSRCPCPVTGPIRPKPTSFLATSLHPPLFPHLPLTFPSLHAWPTTTHNLPESLSHLQISAKSCESTDLSHGVRDSPLIRSDGLPLSVNSTVSSSSSRGISPSSTMLPITTAAAAAAFLRHDAFSVSSPFRACGNPLSYSHLGFQAFRK